MTQQLIQIVLPKDQVAAVTDCLDDLASGHWFQIATEDDGRQLVVAALQSVDTQKFLDRISEALEGKSGWYLHVLPTEGGLPEIDDEEEQERIAQRETARAREAIYSDIRQGTALTLDYLVLTALATVVAAIGLSLDQVAVVIGAMVIAPLLGPILAFAFAVNLGTVPLMLVALRALAAGLLVAAVSAAALGLMFRGHIDAVVASYDAPLSLITFALPLASGAAAALMVAGGKTSALVGVMVAAALLPPLSATGLLLGGGEWLAAGRALTTVLVNIAAINLSALIVFRAKGIRPRKWETERHATSSWISISVSAVIVALLAFAVFATGGGWW
jgi:uncharacterized hydrophobic protein (TIGR00341 family)